MDWIQILGGKRRDFDSINDLCLLCHWNQANKRSGGWEDEDEAKRKGTQSWSPDHDRGILNPRDIIYIFTIKWEGHLKWEEWERISCVQMKGQDYILNFYFKSHPLLPDIPTLSMSSIFSLLPEQSNIAESSSSTFHSPPFPSHITPTPFTLTNMSIYITLTFLPIFSLIPHPWRYQPTHCNPVNKNQEELDDSPIYCKWTN